MRIGLHAGPVSVGFRVGGSNRPSTPGEDAFAMGIGLIGFAFALFPTMGLLAAGYGVYYLRKRNLKRYVPWVFVVFPILLVLWGYSVWSYGYNEGISQAAYTPLDEFKAEMPDEFPSHLAGSAIPAMLVAAGLFGLGWLALRIKDGAKWAWGKL